MADLIERKEKGAPPAPAAKDDDDKHWPPAPMAEITVPLKAVWATWLEDRARRNGRSVVAEVQKIIAETWREDPYRLAQGGSQPVKAK